MEREGKCKTMMMKLVILLTLLVLVTTTFQGCSAAANQEQHKKRKQTTTSPNRIGTSAVFPVQGNVYPIGYYYVELIIGYPPKPYFLDIDTGSDLTWLQCNAPCEKCEKVPHPLYPLKKNSQVLCKDPLCTSLHEKKNCQHPTDQCKYEVEYADNGFSRGVLVKDAVPLRFTNGSQFVPLLAFGCGYHQEGSSGHPSPTDGVLGLGTGKTSIVSQLQSLGLIQNVIGHCFSSRGGGFLFFGDTVVPSSGVVWTPMLRGPMNENYYSPGAAELFLGKQSTGVKGLHVVFDSGSSYTYFNSKAYHALVSSIMKDLSGKPLKVTVDATLPICWKGAKPFKSVIDVKKYFKPIIVSFTNGKKAQQMEIPPESYLIISEFGNVCSGILNGTEVGLEDHLNLIGDIFFQDRMVIYDNERQQIGWVPADCNRLSKSGIVHFMDRDREDGLSQPYSATMGILTEEYCPASSTFQEDEHVGSWKCDEI